MLVIFAAWLTSSIAVIPRIEIGLDQEIAMPDHSDVLKYFTHLKSYLSVGPPVYFVLNNSNHQLDLTKPEIQNKICGGQGCNGDSLQSQIKLWSKKPQITYIGSPAQSWIDDYFGWSKDCCQAFKADGEFCPSGYVDPTNDQAGDYGDYGDYGDFSSSDDSKGCEPCPTRKKSRPDAEAFENYIQWFLSDVPGTACPKAGKAAYSDAVRTGLNQSRAVVGPNNFFAFHTVLKTSEDYYEALRWARRLAQNITDMINRDEPGKQH